VGCVLAALAAGAAGTIAEAVREASSAPDVAGGEACAGVASTDVARVEAALVEGSTAGGAEPT